MTKPTKQETSYYCSRPSRIIPLSVRTRDGKKCNVQIRQAQKDDFQFVVDLMDNALEPYYGGDHRAHAKRIFSTHISGGKDEIGHFSFEQKMFIIVCDTRPAGMINIVGKRQGTYKISPIIVAPDFQGRRGLGTALLKFAEEYVQQNHARQVYCTVAEQNNSALQFFSRNGYIVAGRSDSHYKLGITELMLYKPFFSLDFDRDFDRPNISVQPMAKSHESQVRELLLLHLPKDFGGIDSEWIDALFRGYQRRELEDINVKYKLIYVAIDRTEHVLGIAGATPKKGEPIKIMPFVAENLPGFLALLTDIPYALKPYGHKLYIHIIPTVEQTIALQQRGWRLNAAMPAAYQNDRVTQQWSLDILGENFVRTIRTKQFFLDMIKEGKKAIDIRVLYRIMKTIQPGERIRFSSRTDEIIMRVRDVRKYSTFERLLEHENPSRIIPDLSASDVLKRLREIYPPKLEKRGVLAIELDFNN